MSGSRYRGAARELDRLFRSGTVAGLSEEELLGRFLESRDDIAFEAIVVRHGPKVLNVCRSVLRDPHDVEDAFQATFLVFLRKAKSIRDPAKLAEWLHGAAYRVSIRLRADNLIRHARESRGAVEAGEPTTSAFDAFSNETGILVHEEIRKLPERYRTILIVFYMDGLSYEEAAERLGWPHWVGEGTAITGA